MSNTVRGLATRLFRGSVDVRVETLRKWNLAAAIILAAQAAAVLLFSATSTLPVYISYLTGDNLQSKLRDAAVTAPAIREFMQINVAWLVAGMLIISAIAYAMLATVWRARYERWLGKSWQPLRWVMLVVVAGSVFALLALLAGIQSLESVKMLILLSALGSFAGLQLELRSASRRGAPELSDWIGLVIALIAAGIPWLMLLFSLVATNLFGSLGVPTYLWWLVGTTFIGGVLFALNAHFAYLRLGRWKQYRFSELCASVLIVLIQTAFTWQLFAAILRP